MLSSTISLESIRGHVNLIIKEDMTSASIYLLYVSYLENFEGVNTLHDLAKVDGPVRDPKIHKSASYFPSNDTIPVEAS